MGRRRKGGGCRSSSSSAGRDREAERARREQARSEQLAEAQARRDARRAAQLGNAEAQRAALSEQLQGRAAGVDLAPEGRPRREPRPIDRLIERL